MQYMLLIYGDESRWASFTEEEGRAIMAEYQAFGESIRAQGIYVAGDPLVSVREAHTVRVREGRATVSDGSFAETREQLGGYYIVDCETEQEALDAAARIPNARDGSIEVRALVQMTATA